MTALTIIITCALVLCAIECLTLHIRVSELQIQLQQLQKQLKSQQIDITKNIACHTKAKAINLSAMARATGIPYTALYASLGDKNRDRPLSVDEAFLVCKFLGEKVEDFAEEKEVV